MKKENLVAVFSVVGSTSARNQGILPTVIAASETPFQYSNVMGPPRVQHYQILDYAYYICMRIY